MKKMILLVDARTRGGGNEEHMMMVNATVLAEGCPVFLYRAPSDLELIESSGSEVTVWVIIDLEDSNYRKFITAMEIADLVGSEAAFVDPSLSKVESDDIREFMDKLGGDADGLRVIKEPVELFRSSIFEDRILMLTDEGVFYIYKDMFKDMQVDTVSHDPEDEPGDEVSEVGAATDDGSGGAHTPEDITEVTEKPRCTLVNSAGITMRRMSAGHIGFGYANEDGKIDSYLEFINKLDTWQVVNALNKVLITGEIPHPGSDGFNDWSQMNTGMLEGVITVRINEYLNNPNNESSKVAVMFFLDRRNIRVDQSGNPMPGYNPWDQVQEVVISKSDEISGEGIDYEVAKSDIVELVRFTREILEEGGN